MVIGLERFKAHFAGLEDSYILIGGSACDVNLNALGGAFRVTKDLDIVLCVEARTNEFARAFWRFVREGGYAIAQRSSDDGKGRKLFYRFQNPSEAHRTARIRRMPARRSPPTGCPRRNPNCRGGAGGIIPQEDEQQLGRRDVLHALQEQRVQDAGMVLGRSSRTGADTPQVVPRADQFQKTGEFPRLFGKSSQFLFQDWQDQRLDATVRFSKGGHVRLLVLVDKS